VVVLRAVARDPLQRVVVLGPADTTAPVGFNPLGNDSGDHRRRPEVIVDGMLAFLHQLWADSWGPRGVRSRNNGSNPAHASFESTCRSTTCGSSPA